MTHANQGCFASSRQAAFRSSSTSPSDGLLRGKFSGPTLTGYFAANNLATDWKSLEQVNDAGLITTICMAAPFDPAEKQALLEAETGTVRGKLLIAFLEEAVFNQLDGAPAQPRH